MVLVYSSGAVAVLTVHVVGDSAAGVRTWKICRYRIAGGIKFVLRHQACVVNDVSSALVFAA